tara:strand:- start:503 stop:691 length:189 start_codon:yes stop_codon:yes gene_type:complete
MPKYIEELCRRERSLRAKNYIADWGKYVEMHMRAYANGAISMKTLMTLAERWTYQGIVSKYE